MKFATRFVTALNYLFGSPPLTENLTGVTFNTCAYFNMNVAAVSEQEPSTGPAQKKQKKGTAQFKAMLKCNDKSNKLVHHGKALRSNVNMKKRTWTDIDSDTNERSHFHCNTTHPNSYY